MVFLSYVIYHVSYMTNMCQKCHIMTLSYEIYVKKKYMTIWVSKVPLHCKKFEGLRSFQKMIAAESPSLFGMENLAVKPFLEGFQTIPRRIFKELTYYIVFCAFQNGNMDNLLNFYIFNQIRKINQTSILHKITKYFVCSFLRRRYSLAIPAPSISWSFFLSIFLSLFLGFCKSESKF